VVYAYTFGWEAKLFNQYKVSSLAVLSMFALFLTACASGSAIVTGNARPAIDPASVKIYLKEPQKSYEVIGLVQASSDAGWTEQGSQNYAVAELKKQAAKLGANGVLLTATGEKTTLLYGTSGTLLWAAPVTAKTIKGTAIFVHEE
jgi:uncharacterized protein YbjQ (UPF0145 family)